MTKRSIAVRHNVGCKSEYTMLAYAHHLFLLAHDANAIIRQGLISVFRLKTKILKQHLLVNAIRSITIAKNTHKTKNKHIRIFHLKTVIFTAVKIAVHQDNMSVCFIPPYTPLLYSKTGVYMGRHYDLIFALKRILWVLVRTASFMF